MLWAVSNQDRVPSSTRWSCAIAASSRTHLPRAGPSGSRPGRTRPDRQARDHVSPHAAKHFAPFPVRRLDDQSRGRVLLGDDLAVAVGETLLGLLLSRLAVDDHPDHLWVGEHAAAGLDHSPGLAERDHVLHRRLCPLLHAVTTFELREPLWGVGEDVLVGRDVGPRAVLLIDEQTHTLGAV